MARVSGYRSPEDKAEFYRKAYSTSFGSSLSADDLQKHLWSVNKSSDRYDPKELKISVGGLEFEGFSGDSASSVEELPKLDAEKQFRVEIDGREISRIATVKIDFNNKEENKMSERKTVIVELFDDSVGIDAEDSLVFSTTLVSDLNREQIIHHVLMEENVAESLAEHNEYRSDQINEDILNRTGNEVNLKPVKLKELRWVVR